MLFGHVNRNIRNKTCHLLINVLYIHIYIMEKQNKAELVRDKKRMYPKFD